VVAASVFGVLAVVVGEVWVVVVVVLVAVLVVAVLAVPVGEVWVVFVVVVVLVVGKVWVVLVVLVVVVGGDGFGGGGGFGASRGPAPIAIAPAVQIPVAKTSAPLRTSQIARLRRADFHHCRVALPLPCARRGYPSLSILDRPEPGIAVWSASGAARARKQSGQSAATAYARSFARSTAVEAPSPRR
jgi:energy-coupling factor transporter transmembrane protein EcfT